ncbi:MAG TPA: alpha/beta hydrolase [Smithella sp.]|nr:alpha/beta hydrolase [Smithella sp.]
MLKYFNIESARIACLVSESDWSHDKSSLLFIHGSGGDHSVWSHQYARLRKKYNIAAVDLPGHGLSGGSGEKDVSRYCIWVKKLLDILDLKNAVLAGHSLGAAIALGFAINYPEEIRGIVSVGGGMKMPVNSFILDYLKTNPEKIPAEITELICKFSLAKENRPKFLDVLQKNISRSNIGFLYGDLLACNELDLTSALDKIKAPALMICGAEDKMTSPDFSRQLAAGIGGANLEIIAGAGHMVMMERPVEFNIALDKFLASISENFPERR